MEGTVNGYIERIMPLIVEYGLSVVGAIVILIIGWMVAGWAKKKTLKKAQASEKIDKTLVPIFAQSVRILILIITLLAVLNQFGVQTTSIVAVLGASALAIGLALQGTLSNVAAGMMLLILRPFKVGDAVDIGGTAGVVDSISLFTTEMHTFDNVGVSMPNSRVWGNEIKNFNAFDTRRVDMVFGIGYDDDIDKAMSIIKEVLDSDDRVLDEPQTLIEVGNLGDSSVDIFVRPWSKSSDYWGLKFHVTKTIKEKFDENGISIPYPQRDVHMFQKN